MIKILIADDHAIVRKGLEQLLLEEFPLAQIAGVQNSFEVFEKINEQIWDIILLDISMQGQNGIETLKQMRANGVKTPVLIISMHPEDQYAIRALKAGASGFLNKESATYELLAAINKVMSGQKYITPSLAEILANNMFDSLEKTSDKQLSDREMQVLQLIASGKTITEIAKKMFLSPNTISTYRVRILEKLNLKNSSEITRYAIDNKLV